MSETELESLDYVIRHFWADEREHFQECEFNGDDTGDHIFRHLEVLRRYAAK